MYIVEGNIGAGKSTFLNLLAEHLPYVSVTLEPRQSWQSDSHGESILAYFYKNPHRWAYTMETFAMACRVQEHMKEQVHPSPYHIAERSIYSGHYCFALNGYETGLMTSMEWDIYNQWFHFLVKNKCTTPQGFIYLKTDPTTSLERTTKRGRSSETTIPLKYLEQIHDCHERFLIKKENVLPELKETPVLVLECNEEFEAHPSIMKAHAKKVAAFIDEIERLHKKIIQQKHQISTVW
ncbi:deoxynucleoside kinase [Candidatus Babeliales bacterium]|nr:deoxynucleoside kinase [Candidatus Babeliales bacterium]